MQLLNIAIVEDEKAHAKVISGYIEKWAEDKEIKCRISEFPDAEGFLFEWEENRTWDVIFLDIQMPGIGGMELARTIRRQDDRVAIIFATGITDYMQEGYEVAALHYLVKPVDAGKVAACMERVMEECRRKKKEQIFLLEAEDITDGMPGERKTIKLSASEIVYIESFAHDTELHTAGQRVYRDREGIGTWQKRLFDSGFAGSHRSYLVNLLYVLRVEKKEVVLDTGEALPLSRRNQKEFNAAFIRYYSRYLKEV